MGGVRSGDHGASSRSGGLVREPDDLLEVDGLGDAIGQPVEGVDGVVALGGGHEAEVTRRGDDAVVAVQHPQHRQSGGLERAAHLVGMALRAGLVEDDADDAHRRVVGDHALHDRGDRAGRVRDVDDQHDRRSRSRWRRAPSRRTRRRRSARRRGP